MPEYTITVNGERKTVDLDADTPLLWVLRDTLGLTGTKFGCGEGLCGACTVHVDGKAEKSCLLPIAEASGKSITTIEGLAAGEQNPILKTWLDLEVSQCGYCQPGVIMTLAALLRDQEKPAPEEIAAAMSGNLCRCGTYQRMKKAIQRIVEEA